MTGKKLSHFDVLEKLGEGGMGVVYKGRDERLDRPVALKLLPPAGLRDEQRRRRFIQEAKAASALNHPGIVTVHEIGEAAGEHFIAMEFVEGNTLDRLMAAKTLKLREILSIAAQIADAMAAAHAAGILHRDLKPANVIVTPQGRVKVLDFGLAKLSEVIGEHDETRTRALETDQGTILGTVAYMSPEQAEGGTLDARSEIFSLGVVLYEMLAGRRPFRGETRVATMAAILREEPRPASEANPGVSRDLDRLVARCLKKDPARRFQTMADLKVALEEIRDETESGKLTPVTAAPRRPLQRWGRLAAVFAAGMLLTGGAVWWVTRPTPASLPEWNFRRLTFDSGLTMAPALSSDGNLLAYASDRDTGANLDIYVQPVSGGRPLRLTDNAADDTGPQFSPDGSQIVFHSARDGGGIYVVSALGGDARLLAKGGRAPRFSPDGKFVAFDAAGAAFGSAELFVVPAGGGKPRKIETGLTESRTPLWSRDGRLLLFLGRTEQEFLRRVYHWYLIPAEGGSLTDLGPSPGSGSTYWLGDGTLVYAHRGDIHAVSIDLRRGRFAGPPRNLTTGARLGPAFAVDARGTRIVFTTGQQATSLWAMPIDGNQGRPKGELRRWSEGLAEQLYPTATADGRHIACASNRSGNWDIYLRAVDSGKERVVVSTPQQEQRAQISPDGARIAFNVFLSKRFEIGVVPAKGGAPEMLCEDCSPVVGWTPDSKSILFYRGAPVAYFLLDAADGKVRPLLRHSKWDLHRAQFSPDGRWIAVNAKISEQRSALFVVPYRDGAPAPEQEWLEITNGDGQDGGPLWSPDGNLLYFHSSRAGFTDQWAVRLDPATKRPKGDPFLVAAFHSRRRTFGGAEGYAVTKDWIIWSLMETTGNLVLMERDVPAGDR